MRYLLRSKTNSGDSLLLSTVVHHFLVSNVPTSMPTRWSLSCLDDQPVAIQDHRHPPTDHRAPGSLAKEPPGGETNEMFTSYNPLKTIKTRKNDVRDLKDPAKSAWSSKHEVSKAWLWAMGSVSSTSKEEKKHKTSENPCVWEFLTTQNELFLFQKI